MLQLPLLQKRQRWSSISQDLVGHRHVSNLIGHSSKTSLSRNCLPSTRTRGLFSWTKTRLLFITQNKKEKTGAQLLDSWKHFSSGQTTVVSFPPTRGPPVCESPWTTASTPKLA